MVAVILALQVFQERLMQGGTDVQQVNASLMSSNLTEVSWFSQIHCLRRKAPTSIHRAVGCIYLSFIHTHLKSSEQGADVLQPKLD